MEATSLRFAAAARALGQTTREQNLVVPGFRSPPRLAGADRSLRRTPNGHTMIAIRLRGRPWMAVVSDMIEGVLVANHLAGADADAARHLLWTALEAEALLPPTPAPPPVEVNPTPTSPTRAAPARSVRQESPSRSRRPSAPAPQTEAA